MLYEISGYIAPRCNGTGQYVCKYMYMHTVYPHHPVIHICTFLTQIIFARLSMTSLICIDSAYAVAWHAYSTKPPQGRASADCLMNFLMNKLTSSMQTKV